VCQEDFDHKMWGVVLMFVVGREFGSERILNDIIPYESKILRGLPRRASIVFIRETPIPKAKCVEIGKSN